MSYDEEQHRRSRVVIETPTERREVVQHQAVRVPERTGFSGGMVAAVALTAIAATAIVFLFLMNRGDDSDSTNVSINARAAAQPTPYVQQPPVLVQPTPLPAVTVPAPAATPIIIIQQAPAATDTGQAATTAPPASAAATPSSAETGDTAVQSRLDRAFREDRALFEAGVTVTVIDGRATINGTVSSEALKERAERLAYSVRGVQGVDNRITVLEGTP